MLTKLFAAGIRAATPAAKVPPVLARRNPGAPGIPSDPRRLLSEVSANFRFWSLGLSPIPMANPDTLASRKGLRIYEEMRNDDQVKAALALKKLAVTSSGWLLEPADQGDEAEGLTGDAQEVADFAEYALSTMDASVEEALLQVLSALDFGFSVSEVIFRPVAEAGPFKGKIGLRNVKTRSPHDFWFEVDPFDNLLENGIRQFERRYPLWKFLVYSHQKEFGNWYGRSDLREAYRCYAEDTEVLTQVGWKFVGGVTEKDFVATLNPTTGTLEYHRPMKRFSYAYNGELFRHVGKAIDLLVTPNHNMWVAHGHRRPYRFRFTEAKDLPRVVRYKRDAVWSGKGVEYFNLPEVEITRRCVNQYGDSGALRRTVVPSKRIRMDDWLRFFGVWLAEGHTTYTRQAVVGLTQKNGPVFRRICRWAERCGFHVGRSVGKDNIGRAWITNKQLYDYLQTFGKAQDKYIPSEVKNVSRRQARILLKAMWLGDGSHNGYATVSRRLAGDVQEMLLKAGFAGTVKTQLPGPRHFGGRLVYIVSWHRSNLGATDCGRSRRELVRYKGPVYCLEVPNHLMYVRRNGKACWCGNSWWFKDNVLKWWSMFLDRYSIPLAEGVFDSLGGNDSAIADMRTALDNLQAATSITHSKDYELKFPTASISAQGSQTFEQALEAADRRIARAILLPNLLGVSAQGETGSYSQSKVHFDVFMLVVEKLRQDVARTVMTDQLLRRLVAINYGAVAVPTFKFKPFTETDKSQLMSMFNQAVAAGAVQPRPVDEVHVRELTEFPEVPLEEIEADAEAQKAQGGGSPFGGEEGGFPPGAEGGGGTEAGEPSDDELNAMLDEVLGAEGGGADEEPTPVGEGAADGEMTDEELDRLIEEATRGGR